MWNIVIFSHIVVHWGNIKRISIEKIKGGDFLLAQSKVRTELAHALLISDWCTKEIFSRVPAPCP